MRFGPVVFILSLLALLTTAFPVLAVTYGQLQGKIDFKDGLGVAATPFTIVTGTETRKMKSDAQGEFAAVLPIGKAIIKIADFQQSVLITEGEVTAVKLAVPRPGWVVRCVDAQGNLLDVQYGSARYSLPSMKKKAAGWKNVEAIKIAKGILWLTNLPVNMRKLQLIYTCSENDREKSEYQQWDFSSPPASRQLTATGAPGTQFWLFMEDGNGNRLADMPVSGQISFKQSSVDFRIFDNPAKMRSFPVDAPLVDLQTDGRGALFLGRWPAGKYIVTLQAGERSGLPMTVIMQKNGAVGDGSVGAKTYQARLTTRTVTQTVYTPAGKVLPNALVNATYCQGQRAIYLQQQADENGVVCWRDLPPVPVITWGNGLAAAVIPAEGAVFSKPLPAPQMRGERQANIIFTAEAEYQDETIVGSLTGENCYADFSREDSIDDESFADLLEEDEVIVAYGQATAGTTVSLRAMVLSSPPAYIDLPDCYIPYFTGQQIQILRLDFSQFLPVKCKLQLSDGTPVTAVSKLAVSAENSQVNALLGILGMLTNNNSTDDEDENRAIYSWLKPQIAANGTFSSYVPKAGWYRLNVDLFNEATPADQALLFQVSTGAKEITLTLPAPLFELPGGCEVNWVNRHAPAAVRSFFISAKVDSMPLFAPRGDVLACWARPAANRLRIWDMVTGTERDSTLQLRAISLRVNHNDVFIEEGAGLLLQPLLPPINNESYQSESYQEYGLPDFLLNRDTSDPQRQLFIPQADANQQYNLWSGRYLLGNSQSQCEVTIPTEGSAEVSVKLPAPQTENYHSQPEMQQYRLLLPKIDKKELGTRRIAGSANYLHNGTVGNNRNSNALHAGDNWLELPADASTISIQWPGWGIIRNYPLQKSVMLNGSPTLKPTTWTPGITISGKLFDSRGKPCQKNNLSLFLNKNYSNDNYNFLTDQFGKFTISGLLPNQQILLWDGNAGWLLTVTDKNVTDIVLHKKDNPVKINLNEDNTDSQIWWFPDDGIPQQLYNIWGNISLYDLAPGSGWLWRTDNMKGDGLYQYCRLQPGYNYNLIINQPSRTSLGIYFPYVAGQPLPGEVTVTGLEERAGISARYPAMQWVKSAQLGLLAGQISALPTGKYRIGVQTTLGIVESTVEIGEYGAELHLQFPTEDNSSSPASAEDIEKGIQQQIENHMILLRDAIQQ